MSDLEELVEMESILLVSGGSRDPRRGGVLTKVTWMDIRYVAELLPQSGG